MPKLVSMVAVCFVALLGCGPASSSSPGSSPGSDDCDELREQTRLQEQAHLLKNELGACQNGDACVLVAGHADDCTGELACEVPVHVDNEARARNELGAIADESSDCSDCAMADCRGVNSATCNPSTGQCEAQ